MGVLRSPFFISFLVAVVAATVGLIAGVALTFTDLNDAPLPASIWGRSHSYEFRNFLRKATQQGYRYIENELEDLDGALIGTFSPTPPPTLPSGVLEDSGPAPSPPPSSYGGY